MVHQLKRSVGVIEVAHWLKHQCDCSDTRSLYKAERVYDLIAREIADRQVLYLEFGVWKGYSINYWSKLLKNPGSILHGFDSFEGLPEDWYGDYGSGAFSESGRLPKVNDPRVRFFKGWFEETLAHYHVPEHQVLLVNIDCDLYSSTRCVLDFLRQHDLPGIGSWIYFSEFADPEHEFRAFKEFVAATGMRFELVAEANYQWNVALKRVQ
jgi:hypothetical protein